MKSDEDGAAIAEKIWNMFLGGTTSSVRPFGDAVLDGVDIWMRDNQIVGYAALANRLKELYLSDPKRRYYLAGKIIRILLLCLVWFGLA
jgi:chitinase